MTPRTEIIKERHVSSPGERNCQRSDLPQEEMGYLHTPLSGRAISLSLSSDTGQMTEVSDGRWDYRF